MVSFFLSLVFFFFYFAEVEFCCFECFYCSEFECTFGLVLALTAAVEIKLPKCLSAFNFFYAEKFLIAKLRIKEETFFENSSLNKG